MIGSGLIITLAQAVFLTLWLFALPRINEDSYKKIETGQSIKEVVKIISALPGRYGRPEGVTLVPCGPDGRCLDERNPQVAVIVWIGKDVANRVRFSREGKVVGKRLVPVIYFD